MAKAMIIGAGGVAQVAAHKCVENREVFTELCIASRTLSRCEELKKKLDGQGVAITTAQVDADNVP
ncbi:MAG: saccharopine dehydrogenase NADP-binding domain-containing protein, partial [Eubacteriales bacterium]|nr:saccharopine dehydrogenase NADP-binding domain-containing protein [Eubacteriales bacterium]